MFPKSPSNSCSDGDRRRGVIAFQEPGNATLSASALPPSPLLDQIWHWIMELYRKTGMELYAGLRLFSLFKQANLPDPQMHLDAAVNGWHDSPGYEYIAGPVATHVVRACEVACVRGVEKALEATRLAFAMGRKSGNGVHAAKPPEGSGGGSKWQVWQDFGIP